MHAKSDFEVEDDGIFWKHEGIYVSGPGHEAGVVSGLP